MARYAIWNKKDAVIVPTGKVFTAEEWMEKYPVAKLDTITIVCSAGEINGGFFGTLGQMVQMAEERGADFSDCTTPEQKLARIEEFEAAQRERTEDGGVSNETLTATALQSIAASLEYQNMMTLDDVEV